MRVCFTIYTAGELFYTLEREDKLIKHFIVKLKGGICRALINLQVIKETTSGRQFPRAGEWIIRILLYRDSSIVINNSNTMRSTGISGLQVYGILSER